MDSLNRLRNRRPIFTNNNQNYAVMHCTGYVKNSPPAGISADDPNGMNLPLTDTANCLVAIARLQIANMPIGNSNDVIARSLSYPASSQFTIRIAEDSKITFVDHRVVELLGLTSDKLLNQYLWKMVHPADETLLQNTFTQFINNDQMIKVLFLSL